MQQMLRLWPNGVSTKELKEELARRREEAFAIRKQVEHSVTKEESRLSRTIESICLIFVIVAVGLLAAEDYLGKGVVSQYISLKLFPFMIAAGVMWVAFIKPEIKKHRIAKRFKKEQPEAYALLNEGG